MSINNRILSHRWKLRSKRRGKSRMEKKRKKTRDFWSLSVSSRMLFIHFRSKHKNK